MEVIEGIVGLLIEAGSYAPMTHSGMTRSMTVGRFIGGLVAWMAGTGLVFGFVARLYNRWEHVTVARAGAAER